MPGDLLIFNENDNLKNYELLEHIKALVEQALYHGDQLYDKDVKVCATRTRNDLMAIKKACDKARKDALTYKDMIPTKSGTTTLNTKKTLAKKESAKKGGAKKAAPKKKEAAAPKKAAPEPEPEPELDQDDADYDYDYEDPE